MPKWRNPNQHIPFSNFGSRWEHYATGDWAKFASKEQQYAAAYGGEVPYIGILAFFDPDSGTKYACQFDWPVAGLVGMLEGSETIIIYKEKTYEDKEEFLQAQQTLLDLIVQFDVSYSAKITRRLTL